VTSSGIQTSGVKIASGEYRACPPRVVRGAAGEAAMASSMNQTVKLPRPASLRHRAAARHPSLLLRDVMTVRGVGLERHGGDRTRQAGPILLRHPV
jgi:hypothetical protein